MTEFSQKNIHPSPFHYAVGQGAGIRRVPGRCEDCNGKVPLHKGSGQLQEEKQNLCLPHPSHAEKESLSGVAV